MASLLSSYEYDIFISYRHNDNLDGWVTDFVQNLEKELRSTLKDTLTIYFDKNPHDGLLETHSVDKSLEGKLKCLIFIPIISQTYCDPKSFAWQHEFCVFNKLAKEDTFGRDIKLNNGNVASRILPIKIHDLDAEDKSIIENEIGGVLRAIEFIFKSAGVNRPLRAHEDHPQDNLNKAYYRDQINKVANAIKEIITSRKIPIQTTAQLTFISQASASEQKNKMRATVIVVAISLLLIILIYFIYPSLLHSPQPVTEIDKSVAVLAFADRSPDKDQEWFSDGLTDEILNSLTKLNELKVTARTSSFYFKGKDVPLQEIAAKLGVAHVVEGSVRKLDNKLRITAQLIRASDGFHVWSETYDRSTEDLFLVQVDIAEKVAKSLLQELTPEAYGKLHSLKPANVEAYEYFLRGFKAHYEDYVGSHSIKDFEKSERYFLKAISLDPTYAESYGALADLYDSRGSTNNPADRKKFRQLRDSVMQIGYRLNPNSVQTLMTYGLSFMKRESPDLDSAYYYTKKMYTLNPSDVLANAAMGDFYIAIGMYEIAQKIYQGTISMDPLNERNLAQLGLIYFTLGNYQESKKVFEKVLELDDDNKRAHFQLGYYSIFNGDKRNAERHLEALIKMESESGSDEEDRLKCLLLASEGKKEAVELSKKLPNIELSVLSILGIKKEFLTKLDSVSKVTNSKLDPIYLQKNPLCDFVKNEPEFKIILERARNNYAEKLKRFPVLD